MEWNWSMKTTFRVVWLCPSQRELNSELYFSDKHATLARANGVSSEEPLGSSKSTGKAENDKG